MSIGSLEFPEQLAVLREHETVACRLDRDEAERFDGCFGGLHAQSTEPLEFGQRCRSDPAKVTASKFRVGFRDRESKFLHRAGLPERIAITLLIEPTVDRNAPNLSGCLQTAERQRQGRGQALFRALGAEAPRSGTCGIADFVRRQWTFSKRTEDRRT